MLIAEDGKYLLLALDGHSLALRSTNQPYELVIAQMEAPLLRTASSQNRERGAREKALRGEMRTAGASSD